jgi:hypothetical protein
LYSIACCIGRWRLKVALRLKARRERILRGAKDCVNAVASGLDDTSPVLGNLWIEKLAPVRTKRSERAFLVGSHKAAVAGNVRR